MYCFSHRRCFPFAPAGAKWVTLWGCCWPKMYRCKIAQVGQFYIITKTILVQFRGLFYIILAPNSSYQERRFRPYDVDWAIKFCLFWPYMGLNWPRNGSHFPIFLKYELVPEGLIWPTIFDAFKSQNYPSFSKNCPVVKSFRLSHTGLQYFCPFLLRPKHFQKGHMSPKNWTIHSLKWPYFRSWNRSFRFTV